MIIDKEESEGNISMKINRDFWVTYINNFNFLKNIPINIKKIKLNQGYFFILYFWWNIIIY